MGKNKLKKFIGTIMAALGISFGLNGCSDYSKKSVNSPSTNIAEVNNIENAPFEITFMNVGKADSIFLSIDDKNIMIDTGLNSTKDNVVSQLKEKNIDSIDYLILTHMDKDHIGGADAILNEFKVDNVIQADYSKDSKQYNQYIKAIEKNNITPILIHDNINVKTDNAEINIYPALKKSYSQSNDYSIIVSINYGKYNFLFAGDAEEERLAEFINSNNEKYTLVKMPHHGKINSLSEKFIKSINPSYSIITCSDEELPDEDTIKLLNKYNVKNFLTKDGEIVVKTDGNNISISQ